MSVSDRELKLKSESSGTAAATLVCKAPPVEGGGGTFQLDDSQFLSSAPADPHPTTCARPSSN